MDSPPGEVTFTQTCRSVQKKKYPSPKLVGTFEREPTLTKLVGTFKKKSRSPKLVARSKVKRLSSKLVGAFN